jgi:hypothetical protein
VTQTGDFIFRVCFIDPFQGGVMARFAAETLKVKKVAILVDVATTTRSASRLLPGELQAAGRHDRLRAVLQRGDFGLPRAADADQVRQPRGDLRPRLLHRGRHDRAAGAGAGDPPTVPLMGGTAGIRRGSGRSVARP